jgi:hypothetical protein
MNSCLADAGILEEEERSGKRLAISYFFRPFLLALPALFG